jgi:hypothetical protein
MLWFDFVLFCCYIFMVFECSGTKPEVGYRFEGEYVDNYRHGYGELVSNDGSYYKGHFVRGIKTGSGTERTKDGETFVGEWQDGQRQGPHNRPRIKFFCLTHPVLSTQIEYISHIWGNNL